jgi:ureidoacrylate peracid hydrolase
MSLKLDKKSTCLLIIDMQHGFVNQKSTLGKFVNLEPVRQIIPNIKKLIDLCREKKIPIIYTKQEHLLEDADAFKRLFSLKPKPGSALNSRLAGTPPALKGTWDAEFIEELKPQQGDYIVKKQKYSGFYGTNLELLLRTLGVNTILVTGTATNVCVESTIRDAYFRNFTAIAVKEGVAAAGYQDDLHNATLKNVELFLGWVFSLADVVTAIKNS